MRTISHSAKGSTWEEHKYIKRIDGTYYYPDSYEGGRHLPSNTSESSKGTISDNDIENLAKEVIRGNFGNGQTRKDLLGAYYQQVQSMVNNMLKGSSGSTKIADMSNNVVKSGSKAVEKATTQKTKGLDYETIFSTYRKKDKR